MINNKVWSASGYSAGPINSLVGKGESIIDYTNGTGTLITKGKKGIDNQPSSVLEGDRNVIAGNDIDWTNGIKFSDQAAPLTAKLLMYNDVERKSAKINNNMSSLSKLTRQLQLLQINQAKLPILLSLKQITDRQQKQHNIENSIESMNKYDKGKSSWYSRYITSTPGKVSNSTIDFGYLTPAILEGKMLNHWMKELPMMPSIYASNKYAPLALQQLNKMHVDPYSQLRALDSTERAAYYRMQQNGGYTGGLRLAARVALALGNAKQAADILNSTQLQNNQYRQGWAQAALQEGNQDAARRQAANQYAWEAYSKAHGAKTKGIETHLANLGALSQKWLQQRIKNKQYGDILNMYQLDIDNKKYALGALYKGYNNSLYNTDTRTKPNGMYTQYFSNMYSPLNNYTSNYLGNYNLRNPLNSQFIPYSLDAINSNTNTLLLPWIVISDGSTHLLPQDLEKQKYIRYNITGQNK